MVTINCSIDHNPRRQRGQVIEATLPIRQDEGKWLVPSQSGKGEDTVSVNGDRPSCT